jgi:hypothetical protein
MNLFVSKKVKNCKRTKNCEKMLLEKGENFVSNQKVVK